MQQVMLKLSSINNFNLYHLPNSTYNKTFDLCKFISGKNFNCEIIFHAFTKV